jgi:hypothetical protein
MIGDMKRLAEAHLARPDANDLDREMSPEQRQLAALCEPHATGTPVFVLSPDGAEGARLWRREVIDGQAWRLPWIKPGGPNSETSR